MFETYVLYQQFPGEAWKRVTGRKRREDLVEAHKVLSRPHGGFGGLVAPEGKSRWKIEHQRIEVLSEETL